MADQHSATGPGTADGALAPAPPTATSPDPTATDAQRLEDRGSNRSQRPTSAAFLEFVADRWADRPAGPGAPLPSASWA
ncbi:hypothetical protein ICW40_17400, partial [Actinotalea ferrariae]|nr:hypothetical protein [Actinotalea ferrariae]